MKRYLAYIDESGDPIFAEKSSNTFFIGAIVIKRETMPQITEKCQKIKSKYGLSEFKSNRINNFKRRHSICRDLSDLDIKIVTIWVKKEELFGEWFKHKQTFYKYIQRRLNHEIYKLFGSVKISLDKYGSPQYQESLKNYLVKKIQLELFSPEVLIDSAKDNDFIQVSDFICGSIRKALESDFENNELILDLFKPQLITQIVIPDGGVHVQPVPSDEENIDLSFCMEDVKRYLETHQKKQNDPKMKTLEYLYYSAIDGRDDYIYTQEILEWLETSGISIAEEKFRNEVTASLRDEGLIIIGTRRGIKIPQTMEDIRAYLSFSINLALPVLKRLKKAVNIIKAKTENNVLDEMLSVEMQNILKNITA